jgi:hypothetical protein
VATSLNNPALLYQAHGEYAEAEPLYHRVAAIRVAYADLWVLTLGRPERPQSCGWSPFARSVVSAYMVPTSVIASFVVSSRVRSRRIASWILLQIRATGSDGPVSAQTVRLGDWRHLRFWRHAHSLEFLILAAVADS